MKTLNDRDLERAIRTAFEVVKLRRSASSGQLTHEEAIALRDELPTLSHEDFHYYLPEILLDLIWFHQSRDDFRSCERVFEYLNVPTESIHRSEVFSTQEYAQAQKQDSFLRKAKESAFSRFNREQARAIRDWLTYVRDRLGLDDYCLREIDCALIYWRKRCRNS